MRSQAYPLLFRHSPQQAAKEQLRVLMGEQQRAQAQKLANAQADLDDAHAQLANSQVHVVV